jgi:GNAT superfamily N-acetyltransferase
MLTLRTAQPQDTRIIIDLIQALADYEREPDAVKITEADVQQYGFGDNAVFSCIIAEWDGEVAGFALYFLTFSTWEGKPGLYLEDLFVKPEFRGKGIGKALMIRLAQTALERGCTRFQWQVLDWNTPSIEFYESIGAVHLKEWYTYRLSGEALHTLAEQKSTWL